MVLGGAGPGNFFNKAIVLKGGGTSVTVVKLSFLSFFFRFQNILMDFW